MAPLYKREEHHRALGRETTFPWSRALTFRGVTECITGSSEVGRSKRSCPTSVAVILDLMPLFGFGFHDVIYP